MIIRAKKFKCSQLLLVFGIVVNVLFSSCEKKETEHVYIFEVKEILLHAANNYENPYKEVECYLDLVGPDGKRRVYGFWNGGSEFVFRVAATQVGNWRWNSHSNQQDAGLNNLTGSFEAIGWAEQEITENPNRKGFIRATANGHALEYANGTPFFMLGDTWWAASTWRFPLKGIKPGPNYIPKEGYSFEEALDFRKRQGYNTITMIAAFPNWKADKFPPQYMNGDSVGVRQAWEKNGTNTAQDMHDELGNMPFEPWDQSEIVANFDRINPEYFKSLDKKIQYLNDQGFVTFLETIRRDHGPSWKKYFDWPDSFAGYVQYIVARYGAYNIIFSGIHLDWINKDYSLAADDYNDALTYYQQKYGGLPYGQPHTILIDGSTYRHFGHGEAPWLTMHSVGNSPRNHGFYPMLEEIFQLESAYPSANMEPYYPGWKHPYHSNVAGEIAEPDSDRDNYFGRAQMYGSVLSGGLAGHIYGTGAYDGNTTGEPKNEGDRPYVWEALNYLSGAQVQHLGKFMLSEGDAYQRCVPKKELLVPHRAKDAPEKGLDGWSFLLVSPDKDLGFLYFENKSEVPKICDLVNISVYKLHWFDPITGEWLEPAIIQSDENGVIRLEAYPGGEKVSSRDWALKIKRIVNN